MGTRLHRGSGPGHERRSGTPVTGFRVICIPLAAALLSGCIVKTAVDVATVPVKVAGKGVDLATTSKSEKEKKRQKRRAKLQKQHEREMRDCDRGDARACERAEAIRAEIQELDRQR